MSNPTANIPDEKGMYDPSPSIESSVPDLKNIGFVRHWETTAGCVTNSTWLVAHFKPIVTDALTLPCVVNPK